MMFMSQVKSAVAVVAVALVVAGSGAVVAQKMEISHMETASPSVTSGTRPATPIAAKESEEPKPGVAAQAAVSKEIGRLEDAWQAAEVTKDGAAVEQLLTEEFLFTDPDGALFSKSQFIQLVSTSKAERISEVGSAYQVKVYGNTAVIHGIVTTVDKVQAGTRQARLRWTDTWVKQTDGRWRCVAAQSTIIKG